GFYRDFSQQKEPSPLSVSYPQFMVFIEIFLSKKNRPHCLNANDADYYNRFTTGKDLEIVASSERGE
ncbi:MAG: hypothetical protein U9R01_08295, partial [candidate division WOR-3 bacterium]|nr:hypothetical protein [candidate division WOR-3 bacterium]